MGEINRAGREGKRVFETFLREFPNAVTATWVVGSGGSYDEFSQGYVGAANVTQVVSFAAIVESDKVQFKYAKYGVDETTDIVLMVSVDLVVPPQEAYYTKAGDPRRFTLVNAHYEANYGVDSLGNMLYAFKTLHLRSA